MAVAANDIDSCIDNLVSNYFTVGRSPIPTTIGNDSLHDTILTGFPTELKAKPGDLEDTMVAQLLGNPAALKVNLGNFDLNSRDFFCAENPNSLFGNPKNIACRDFFTNYKSSILNNKGRAATNIGLSGMLDQAGASPSMFYNYWGQVWSDARLQRKASKIIENGGLCQYADLGPPHLFGYTGYFNCDLLLNYYYMGKYGGEADILGFGDVPANYIDYLTYYKSGAWTRKELPDFNTALKAINVYNFNRLWVRLCHELELLYKNDEYLKNKSAELDDDYYTEIHETVINIVIPFLKLFVFTDVDMSNTPKLFFRIDKGHNIVYSTSQKGLAEKAQKYNNEYNKKRKHNIGYIKPRRGGEGVTQETRDCVNYIDAAVQHFLPTVAVGPEIRSLAAAIIFSSLKFFGDSSHLANGEEIEAALNACSDISSGQNMVYYLVQEKPYFCRLLYCGKPTIMNPERAGVLKKYFDDSFSKKFLYFQNNPRLFIDAFRQRLDMLYSKLTEIAGFGDDIIVASEIFPPWPFNKGLDEFIQFIGKNVKTAKEEIVTFKNDEQFKRFEKTEEMVHLLILARDNNFGYDDAKFAGIFNSSDMLLTRTSTSKRAASGLPIEFNYSFVINSQNHQNKVLVAMPFLDNIDTLIKLFFYFDGLEEGSAIKVMLQDMFHKIYTVIRTQILEDNNVLTNLLLEKFMHSSVNNPPASRLLYYPDDHRLKGAYTFTQKIMEMRQVIQHKVVEEAGVAKSSKYTGENINTMIADAVKVLIIGLKLFIFHTEIMGEDKDFIRAGFPVAGFLIDDNPKVFTGGAPPGDEDEDEDVLEKEIDKRPDFQEYIRDNQLDLDFTELNFKVCCTIFRDYSLEYLNYNKTQVEEKYKHLLVTTPEEQKAIEELGIIRYIEVIYNHAENPAQKVQIGQLREQAERELDILSRLNANLDSFHGLLGETNVCDQYKSLTHDGLSIAYEIITNNLIAQGLLSARRDTSCNKLIDLFLSFYFIDCYAKDEFLQIDPGHFAFISILDMIPFIWGAMTSDLPDSLMPVKKPEIVEEFDLEEYKKKYFFFIISAYLEAKSLNTALTNLITLFVDSKMIGETAYQTIFNYLTIETDVGTVINAENVIKFAEYFQYMIDIDELESEYDIYETFNQFIKNNNNNNNNNNINNNNNNNNNNNINNNNNNNNNNIKDAVITIMNILGLQLVPGIDFQPIDQGIAAGPVDSGHKGPYPPDSIGRSFFGRHNSPGTRNMHYRAARDKKYRGSQHWGGSNKNKKTKKNKQIKKTNKNKKVKKTKKNFKKQKNLKKRKSLRKLKKYKKRTIKNFKKF